jgi:hypothetical protein
MRFGVSLLICLTLLGCQIDPPQEEYSLARAAIEAAREADAAKYSPGYWHKAQTIYQQAENYYQDRNNEMAKTYFVRARIYAERAENAAQLARAKGDEE